MALAVARFGPFEVVSRIGFGGMGEVFRARYAGEGGAPEIALKLIRPEHATDPRFRQMFLAEARVSALLDHANIVGMVDWGDVDGVLYLASELVDGISLHRLLSAPSQPTLEVGAYILGAVLDALAYAHELRDIGGRPLGLVHRDVSPANVLLSRTGGVKLADFGVSKIAGAPATWTGELKGKPGFMAPEQLPGHDIVDGRADLFAVGVMLHLAVFGRAPFSDVGNWLNNGAPIDVDGPFADLITLSLAPDPAHRFGSAGEFATALRRAVPASDGVAAELARRVRELAAGERPLTDMERLIMSQLEPSGLVYAPDPSTGRLWVLEPEGRTPTPARAFDESAPTEIDTYDVPEMTPTIERESRTTVIARDPPAPAPPPALLQALILAPPPPPPPIAPPDAPTTLTSIARADSLPTPTPTPLLPLGSSPLPLDPVRSRRRLFPILALVTALVAASVVAVVIAASSREGPLLEPTLPTPPVEPAPPTPEPPKAEPPKAELPKAEPPKAESPKLESPKAELPKSEPPTPEPPATATPEPPPPIVRAKPRPPRPAPEPAIGFLTLDTEPWSVVYLGTRELGTTPFLRVPVPAGRQQLTFDLLGSGRRVRRPVDIPAGGVKRLVLQLR